MVGRKRSSYSPVFVRKQKERGPKPIQLLMFEPGTSWVKQTAVPLRKQQGGPITVQRRKDFSSQGRQLHVTFRHMKSIFRCRLRIAITSAFSLMLQYFER